MRKLIFAASLAVSLGAAAVDYTPLEGLSGAALKQKVKELALNHVEISYGDATWDAFETCDVQEIEGQKAWFDMYSNRLVYVASGHNGMNIEHAVANSWWDGVKNAAYKDLHHLNPSDADANNRKSDKPLGVIAGTPTWSNGLTNIGTPAAGYGGGANSVFEPADEFKGNFARAYFYIFTLYDDISWKDAPACMYDLTSYPTLQPWAYEMLLDWAAADPVDEREAARNASVEAVQKNSNPYIAIPGLAEYVWGAKKNQPFSLADAMTSPAPNRPAAPTFGAAGEYNLAGVNTWTGRWWDAFDLTINAPAGSRIYYTLTDSDEYQVYSGPIEIGGASALGQSVTVKAYAESQLDGKPYRGSVATLTLASFNPSQTDYQNALWQKVISESQLTEDDLYVIVSTKAYNVMGWTTAATASSGYVSAAGVVTPDGDKITQLPQGASLVKLVSDGGTLYYIDVYDLDMTHKGFLATNEVKKLGIAEEGRAASVSLTPQGNVKVDFGEYGWLQYNAQQPRFSVYTSTQQAVDFYRLIPGSTGIEGMEAPAAEGEPRIFSLDGIEVGTEVPAGIYIKVYPSGRTEKVVLK